MKLIKKLISLVFIVLFICGAFLVWRGHSAYKKAIEETGIEEMVEAIRSKESYTTYEELPEMYVNAVICAEDHRFNHHNGVDFMAVIRAAFNNIKQKTFAEGGSTITQQLAKNMYFDQDKNFTRKIAEMFVAFDIEKLYSKKEILEIYVNYIYFGENCYDIRSASNYYFGCQPKDMDGYQCTMLAGIPNAPSLYNPKNSGELASQRQRQVLEKMVKYKYISEEYAEEIMKGEVDIEVKNRLDDFFNGIKKSAKKAIVDLLIEE